VTVSRENHLTLSSNSLSLMSFCKESLSGVRLMTNLQHHSTNTLLSVYGEKKSIARHKKRLKKYR
jgi:hypothetical protein